MFPEDIRYALFCMRLGVASREHPQYRALMPPLDRPGPGITLVYRAVPRLHTASNTTTLDESSTTQDAGCFHVDPLAFNRLNNLYL